MVFEHRRSFCIGYVTNKNLYPKQKLRLSSGRTGLLFKFALLNYISTVVCYKKKQYKVYLIDREIMKKEIIFLMLTIIFINSCHTNKTNKIEKLVPTEFKGKIVERYNDTLARAQGQIINSIDKSVISEGSVLYNLKDSSFQNIGWHSYYNNNIICERIQYETVITGGKEKEIPNQYILFDTNGDTIKEKSSYFTVYSNYEDTLYLGDTILIEINVFHELNKKELVGSYKLFIDNSVNKDIQEYQFNKTLMKYSYIPIDTGKIDIEGRILFYLQQGERDSVEVIDKYFGRNYIIK